MFIKVFVLYHYFTISPQRLKMVFFRETSLLYSEGSSSASAKQWVAIVVAHELAHQVS